MHKYLLSLKEIAESKGGKLLSEEYNGAHSKYKFVDELGNEFEAAGYSIKNGRWSPYTAQKRKAQSLFKYTIEDLKKKAKEKGGDCLSSEFMGYKKKYHWIDSKNREFFKTFDEVLNGQWSPHEKKERLSELKTLYNIQNLKEFASSKGGECLSDQYTRGDSRYVWKDRNGTVFERSWSEILRADDVLYVYGGSKQEFELVQFVESLGFEVIRNSRKVIPPLELDIFIPELNIAIEYNGSIWHSEFNGKDRNYHVLKTQECSKNGIQLIQIFDFEWNNRQEQVKSFLLSKLNRNSIRLYARKCQVIELSTQEAKNFLGKYHILGSCNFIKAFGLIYNNEVQSMICIGRHHRNNSEMVLSRYVGKTGVTVAGGLSKLVSAAVKEFGKLSTWVDLRWSNGESWINSGWELERVLPPDYFYLNTKNRTIISKQSRKKSSVNTPNHMTEKEHAESEGLTRIWDCGKIKLVYRKS